MSLFDTYEVIKKRVWVRDTTGDLYDGHAEEVYVIKKNGYIAEEKFSSPEAANKYIDDFLTENKEEIVDWRYYFDKNSYWRPSKDLTTPIDWDPATITCGGIVIHPDGTVTV